MFFRRYLAAAAVVALTALGGVSAASANVSVGHSFSVDNPTQTELSPVVFGNAWVANDYKGLAANNTIVSVFNDVGANRSFFTVNTVETVAVGTFAGDKVVTVQDMNGAYLSDWNNSNPTVQGWRGRFDYAFNNDVSNDQAAWFYAVPNSNGSFDLVSFTNPTLALTVGQGNTNVQSNGVPGWSDTVYLPWASGDPAQEWNFKLPVAAVEPTFPVDVVKSQRLGVSTAPFTVDPLSTSDPEVLSDSYQIQVTNESSARLTDVLVSDNPVVENVKYNGTALPLDATDPATWQVGELVLDCTVDNNPVVNGSFTLEPGQSAFCSTSVTASEVTSALTALLLANDVPETPDLSLVGTVAVANQAIVTADNSSGDPVVLVDGTSNTVLVTYTPSSP